MLRSVVSNSPPVSFCRWAGCVRMNNSLIAETFRSRSSPRLTPIRTLDNKCIVSSELIVWRMKRANETAE